MDTSLIADVSTIPLTLGELSPWNDQATISYEGCHTTPEVFRWAEEEFPKLAPMSEQTLWAIHRSWDL